jgi:hypothetical protein
MGLSKLGPSRPLVTSPIFWPSCLQLGVLAHGYALQGDQAHALAGQAGGVVELGQHLVGTGEAARARAAGAAHLLHGPVQAASTGVVLVSMSLP